jgi:hypothetical protein
MQHHQDCFESVSIDDIVGDLDDLIGSKILMSECVTKKERKERVNMMIHLLGLYKFATVKGYVTIRWYGTSNGYSQNQ